MRSVITVLVLFMSWSGISQTKPDTITLPTEELALDTTIYDLVRIEKPAQYPGGDSAMFRFLADNVKYPALAKKMNLQGKVFVEFVINKNGEVASISILRGLKVPSQIDGKEISDDQKEKYAIAAQEMNEEALRVIRMMPAWTPGQLNGKNVRMRFILPLYYKLR